MTQIGLMLEGQAGLTWSRWQRLLEAAETFGYQCVFRSDHFTIAPPYQESLEAWVSLTYAASHTQRIEMGTCVSPTTFRHPSMTVRMAAAVDDLSNGRLIYGMGAGWNEREHKQFGVPFYDVPTRFEMLVDALEITTRLLRQEQPVSYTGTRFSVEDAVLLERPKRATPILIGGNGPTKTLPLAAKYADEWNGVFISPADYKERNTRLNELLEKEERDPNHVKRSLMTQIVFAYDDAELQSLIAAKPDLATAQNMIVGTASQVIDKIGAYVDAGVERLMLQWLALDDIARIEKVAQTVLPHFHKAG